MPKFGQVFHRLGLLPSFLPSFKGITLFRHFAPGPRPRHSIRPADFNSCNPSRIMSRLTPGQARSKSVMLNSPRSEAEIFWRQAGLPDNGACGANGQLLFGCGTMA